MLAFFGEMRRKGGGEGRGGGREREERRSRGAVRTLIIRPRKTESSSTVAFVTKPGSANSTYANLYPRKNVPKSPRKAETSVYDRPKIWKDEDRGKGE